MSEDIGAEEVKKIAFVPEKTEQKQKLSMDPMVEISWKLTNYSGPTKESISLVGKSTVMLSITLGGFCTPNYLGWPNEARSPTIIFWQKATRGPSLPNQMECYMKLMRYAPTNWLDVMAMWVEGTASSWVNAVL